MLTNQAGTRQEERAAHPGPPRVCLQRYPGSGEPDLLRRLVRHEKTRCLNGLGDFSVSGEKTGSKTRSYPAGLGIMHHVAALQKLSQENSSEEAVAASLSFCHPALGLLASGLTPAAAFK